MSELKSFKKSTKKKENIQNHSPIQNQKSL